MIRYNSDDDVFEGYASGAWGNIVKENSLGEIDTSIFVGSVSIGTQLFKRNATSIFAINGNNNVGSCTFMQGNTFSYSLGIDIATNNIFKLTTGNSPNSGNILFSIDKATQQAGFDSLNASLKLPTGTTAQRPTGNAGMIRFNTDTSKFEGFDGTTWIDLN